MALRNILKNEDPMLRKNCRPVTEFNDRLWQLLDDMADTMYKAEGVTYRGGTNPAAGQHSGDKVVTDFTGMSDAEIYAALKNNAKLENR